MRNPRRELLLKAVALAARGQFHLLAEPWADTGTSTGLWRSGVEIKLVITPGAQRSRPARLDPVLIKAVARGHLWFDDLATGRVASIQAIADREGIREGYIRRLVGLAFLAPSIIALILRGEQPIDLTAEGLTRRIKLPLSWIEQQQLLGR